MVDRIADPWGERTPYSAGEPWPVRVDAHPGDPGPVDGWFRSASVLHSNGDAMDIAVRGGRIVGVRGRADDRVNHGRLGPKGSGVCLTPSSQWRRPALPRRPRNTIPMLATSVPCGV